MKNKTITFITIIALLLGTFALSPGKAEAAPFTILNGPDMTIGDTGQNVVQLQALLSELGYLVVPIGIPLGYFGPLTQGALSRYQGDMGVTPQSGYYGPLTRQATTNYLNSKGWLSLIISA